MQMREKISEADEVVTMHAVRDEGCQSATKWVGGTLSRDATSGRR